MRAGAGGAGGEGGWRRSRALVPNEGAGAAARVPADIDAATAHPQR